MSKSILIRTSDAKTFEVDTTVASLSQTIKDMIDADCAGQTIPLPNVTSTIFELVLKYCVKHTEKYKSGFEAADGVGESSTDLVVAGGCECEIGDGLDAWDEDFVKDFNMAVLFELILAANFLNIKGLLDLTTLTVADRIKDYSVEQVRKLFNIENDFTPEEEEELRKQNHWVHESKST